jgi:hypothetical protein
MSVLRNRLLARCRLMIAAMASSTDRSERYCRIRELWMALELTGGRSRIHRGLSLRSVSRALGGQNGSIGAGSERWRGAGVAGSWGAAGERYRNNGVSLGVALMKRSA